MGTSKRRVSYLKAIQTWSWATCSTAWVGGLDQMTTRGLFQPQSLLFCDVHMQMDYIPWHARPGKDLQTLSRPVDLRAYRNEHLILSQQFSKHPAGKAHQELIQESLTQCRGIKWATIDSSHLHFCDSTACNKSVMPQLWLQAFWWVGFAAGDIELVSFVGKEQAYMQCGHKKSSPCPGLYGILCFTGSGFTFGYRIDPTGLSSPQLFASSPSSAMLPHTLFIAKVPLPVPLHNNCIRSAAQLER